MKTPLLRPLVCTAFLLAARALLAADVEAPASWKAQSLAGAVLNMVIFAVIGIVIALVGFKVFDQCTPGDLAKEIIENKNVAAAIIGAAVILGVCLIVAAAMVG